MDRQMQKTPMDDWTYLRKEACLELIRATHFGTTLPAVGRNTLPTFEKRASGRGRVEAEQCGQLSLLLERVVLHVEKTVHLSPGGRKRDSQSRQKQTSRHLGEFIA